jgi:hypothetical protein
MIPNATRRIITELSEHSPQDICALIHASRIFNNLTGAFLMLRKGMSIESNILIRGALETTAQAILFMRDPNMAAKWLNGKQYSPADVRKGLQGRPDFKPLYDTLSEVAHANPQAQWMHTVAVEEQGLAILYGGAYQPKLAAHLLTVIVDILLMYLSEFHAHYIGRLSVQFWPLMIEMGGAMNADLRRWRDQRAEDWVELAPSVSTQHPSPMPPPAIPKADLDRVLAAMDEWQRRRATQESRGEVPRRV